MRTVHAMVKTFGLGFSLRCFASSTQRKKYVERENCLKSNKKKNPQKWRNLTSLEKEKNNNDKTPKQTNKQRKERQKPLTHKTTFL